MLPDTFINTILILCKTNDQGRNNFAQGTIADNGKTGTGAFFTLSPGSHYFSMFILFFLYYGNLKILNCILKVGNKFFSTLFFN
jgi:hypothetical protein